MPFLRLRIARDPWITEAAMGTTLILSPRVCATTESVLMPGTRDSGHADGYLVEPVWKLNFRHHDHVVDVYNQHICGAT